MSNEQERAALKATPEPATLADRLRAKEAQEIASKFDTRAALEQARKDRAATPAPAEPVAWARIKSVVEHMLHLARIDNDEALPRYWNELATLAATPAPAPAGYVAAEIYAAWRKVGADVCGLKWDAFVDALRAAKERGPANEVL